MKIVCIGRNYIDHAKEMNSPVPKEPVFFLKPESAILIKRNPFFYPEFSQDIHYETELVFRIHKNGKYIQEKFAHTYYNEIGVGFDFTARDLQQKCKDKGLPWEVAKAFDQSAALSEFFPLSKYPDIQNINFSLKKNGELVQSGNSGEMIFNINKIIEYVSQFMTLKMGDLIFTGTPAGVGPIKVGDKLEAFIENEKMLDVKVK